MKKTLEAVSRGKGLKVPMKLQEIDSSDPVSILGFLSAFKLACDMRTIYTGDALSLPHFLELPAANEFDTCSALKSNVHELHNESYSNIVL